MIQSGKIRIALEAGLVLGCMALAWLVYHDLVALPYESQPKGVENPAPQALPTLTAETQFLMPSIGAFRETIQRPIFSQSRRPPEKEQVAEKTSAPNAELDLIVRGIVFSAAERIAFVSPKDNRSVSRSTPILQLSEGAEYKGWTVAEIAPKEVTFRQNDRDVSLKLDFRPDAKSR